MSYQLPATAEQIDLTRWEAIAPYYAELATRPLALDHVHEWLAEWSRLSELVSEAASWLSIAFSQNTEDPARKEAYLNYVRHVAPQIEVANHGLKVRLLATGCSADGMATALRQFQADVGLYRDDNVPLQAESRALASHYSELIASLTVTFDGQERTLAQLAPYRALPDRSVREAAWRAGQERMLAVRAELDELYDGLFDLRRRMAENAGYETYRDYLWTQLGRFDYTPDDALRFQEAILEAVVPALERHARRRVAALELASLRPWDLEVDPHEAMPLRPFKTGEELAEGSIRIFDQVDPELGNCVRMMRDEGLLDLDNRKGKAPGGYCATLAARGRPFIFMNAVGTEDNVRTMLHEAGHAFHVFERQGLPYVWQRRSPMEFAEVASMTMELLTAPYIGRDSGGFYTPREKLRASIQHLERIIGFLPYMATVDAFQHWVYAHPQHTHDERDAAWLRLHKQYCIEADWTGLEETRESLWQHKQHIFNSPFYYIEYGIAQLGALQIWRNSLHDPQAALRDYRAALALGGTRPLPELFAAAGAQLAFDTAHVAELVQFVEEQIGELEEELARMEMG